MPFVCLDPSLMNLYWTFQLISSLWSPDYISKYRQLPDNRLGQLCFMNTVTKAIWLSSPETAFVARTNITTFPWKPILHATWRVDCVWLSFCRIVNGNQIWPSPCLTSWQMAKHVLTQTCFLYVRATFPMCTRLLSENKSINTHCLGFISVKVEPIVWNVYITHWRTVRNELYL